MKISVGQLFYAIAVGITVLVVGSKYFHVSVPPVSTWLMADATASLLAALVLALLSRWL
jgi:hypothetical protein